MIITTYRCLRFTPSSILSTPRSRLRALSTIPHCSLWVDLVSVPLRRTILSDPLKSLRLRPAVTYCQLPQSYWESITKRFNLYSLFLDLVFSRLIDRKFIKYCFAYPWFSGRYFSHYSPGHRDLTLDSHVFKGIVTRSRRAIIKLLYQH